MSESNYRICKVCKHLKQRIQNGTFPNGRDKKWVDAEDQLWSGSTCGPCNSKRIRKLQKKKEEGNL